MIETPEELVSKLISASASFATMEADMADIIRSDREAIRSECAKIAEDYLRKEWCRWTYSGLWAAIMGAMSLQTLAEYRAQHPRPNINQERWKPTGVACPKCGHELLWDSMVTLTSYPPQQYWACPDCNHVEYV